jgi:hypothetical protein
MLVLGHVLVAAPAVEVVPLIPVIRLGLCSPEASSPRNTGAVRLTPVCASTQRIQSRSFAT